MPRITVFSLIHILAAGLLLLAACTPKPQAGNRKLHVVATTGMIGDAARSIAGTHADVQTLMGPGVDPHLYKATPSDLDKLQHATLILYNGLHLEGKMGDVLGRLRSRKHVMPVTDGIDVTLLRKAEGNPTQTLNAPDPHVWFDVSLWRKAVASTADALKLADSTHATAYNQNWQQYDAQLDSLHSWVLGELQKIPAERRVLVTAHDAFGYFGRAYGMEVRGLQGISTAAEFGLRDINELVTFLVQRKIPAVFIESSVAPKSLEAVVEGCRARGHSIRIGGTLYSDALGNEGTPEATYIGMVTHNVNAIVAGLK